MTVCFNCKPYNKNKFKKDRSEFMNRLKELRKSRNLTQDEMAKKINLPRSTYSNYETGKREPDYYTLEQIAEYFGVTVDYLLGRNVVPEDKTEWIIKELVRKYKVDLTDPKKYETLEKLIQVVADLTKKQ
jgi:transcriptional regulator with XRE-family HTH domain